MNPAADLILTHGRFTTLNPGQPAADAVAIRDGRFVAVGTEKGMADLAGPLTRTIDLQGRRVLPGLIDNHLHIIRGGLNFNMELRWDGVRSLSDAMSMLKAQVARTPAPQWVRVIGGFTEHQFTEKRLPTIEELNAVAPDTLVTRALQVSGAAPAGRRHPDLAPFNLRRVREHIDSRLAERITVEDLASVAGLSRGHFSRAFHAATGESPHQFIVARRLAEARQRLDEGAGDLAQIAIQTGFSSHAHLTTAFGQAFGVTPQAYRRLRRAADQGPALAPPVSAEL